MSLPGVLNLTGNRWGVYRGDTWGPKKIQLSRVVRDANASASSATLTSATALFATADVGVRVVPLLADGTPDPGFGTFTIASVTNATTVQLNASLPAALSNRLLMIMRRDVTGYVFTAQIRTSANKSGSPAATIACSVLDATMGVLQLQMANTITDGLTTAGSGYVWDLQSVASGVTKTWLKGSVSVDADVTS